MPLILQEDDMRLLRLISISGVCTIEQSKSFYSSSPNKYHHYTRIRRLVESGYLTKEGKLLELTEKAASLFGETKYRFRYKSQRLIQCEISNIVSNIPEVEVVSNRFLRRKYGLDRKTFFKGAFVVNNEEHFFYFVPSDTKLQLIAFIKAEMRSLAGGGICNKSVVFAKIPDVMEYFSADESKQRELLP